MLVLAIVALEVPLILSLRDRVDNEVRSQARSQADFLAAAVDLTDRTELDRVTAELARGCAGA